MSSTIPGGNTPSVLDRITTLIYALLVAGVKLPYWLLNELCLMVTGQWSDVRLAMSQSLNDSLQEPKLGIWGVPSRTPPGQAETEAVPPVREDDLATVSQGPTCESGERRSQDPIESSNEGDVLFIKIAPLGLSSPEPSDSSEEEKEEGRESGPRKNACDPVRTINESPDPIPSAEGILHQTLLRTILRSPSPVMTEEERLEDQFVWRQVEENQARKEWKERAREKRGARAARMEAARRPTEAPISRSRRQHSPLNLASLPLILALLCSSMTTYSMTDAASAQEYDLDKREYDPALKQDLNFTAFNCARSHTREWKGLDLTEVAPCPDADHDYLRPRDLTVSLVQSHVPISVELSRCELIMSKKIKRHDGRVDDGLTNLNTLFLRKRIGIPGEVCQGMINSLEFVCDVTCGGGKASSKIKLELGKEVTTVWNTRGDYDKDLWSEASTFEVTYDSGVVERIRGVEETILTIYVSKHKGYVDLSTNKIWSDDLHFQSRYDLAEHAVNTREYGTVAWTYQPWPCSKQLALIATTQAVVRQLRPDKRPGNGRAEYAGALVIVRNATEQRVSGMVISENRHLCMPECFLTNVPKLLLCIESDVSPLDAIESRASAQATATRINQQALGTYLEIAANVNLHTLHKRMQEKICDLDVRSTKQDFAFLMNAKSQYALQGMTTGISEYPVLGENGTAFTVLIRGSTAYFSRCEEENVQVVALPRCSLQIPIIRDDGSLSFADAINHHIVEYPTWVECETGLPVQYRIGDKYYCHSGNSHKSCPQGTEPFVLRPSIGAMRGIKVEDLPVLGGLTLNNKQLDKIADLKQEYELGSLILDDIKTKVMGSTRNSARGASGIHFGIPLTDLDIELISTTVASNLFFFFRWFGRWYLNLFGVFMAFAVLKHFADTGVRIYYLIKQHGLGFWIIRALWGSLWATAALPKVILAKAYQAVDDKLAEARETTFPDEYVLLKEENRDMKDKLDQLTMVTDNLLVANREMLAVQKSRFYSSGLWQPPTRNVTKPPELLTLFETPETEARYQARRLQRQLGAHPDEKEEGHSIETTIDSSSSGDERDACVNPNCLLPQPRDHTRQGHCEACGTPRHWRVWKSQSRLTPPRPPPRSSSLVEPSGATTEPPDKSSSVNEQ